MTVAPKKIPGITNAGFWLSAGVILAVLYFGKPLFVPMSFGLLLAIVAYPACKWLERKKVSRSLSTGIIITGIMLLFLSLLFLLAAEINILAGKKQDILVRLGLLWQDAKLWLDDTNVVDLQKQKSLADGFALNLEKNIGSILNGIFSATGSAIVSLILVPIFSVLFLLHRETFVRFIESIVGDKYKSNLRTILNESILSYFRFVKGTFFVYCIVGVLNSIGLLLLGIEHAILFGVITAFMTIIPYIGIIISAALPISIALITKDSLLYPVGVVAVFSFVQYLEANVIYPRVVGGQLNLSTWSVLVTIIAGTLLWGIAGMILFVPFLGILKIIANNIPELEPVNILLGRNETKK